MLVLAGVRGLLRVPSFPHSVTQCMYLHERYRVGGGANGGSNFRAPPVCGYALRAPGASLACAPVAPEAGFVLRYEVVRGSRKPWPGVTWAASRKQTNRAWKSMHGNISKVDIVSANVGAMEGHLSNFFGRLFDNQL